MHTSSPDDAEFTESGTLDFASAADFATKTFAQDFHDYINDPENVIESMVGPTVPSALKSHRSRTRRRAQVPAIYRDPYAHGDIRFHLNTLMRKAGIVNKHGPKDTLGEPSTLGLARHSGISPNTCWQLLRHPDSIERLDLGTLARLCATFGCQPGDLLEYVPHDTPPKRNVANLTTRKTA